MLTTGEPTPEYEVAAESIARAAHETDGIDPLNEAARFALRVPGAAIHWLVVDEETPVAYAQWHRGDRSGIAVVHPEHRRRGIGRDLVDHMSGESGAGLVNPIGPGTVVKHDARTDRLRVYIDADNRITAARCE